MRIDVADLIFANTGIGDDQLHAAHRAFAFFRRGGDVIGVTVHAVPNQLRIHTNSAPPGVLQLFQHDDTRAFAEHEPVSVLIERAAGFGRFVVPERERFRGGKAGYAKGVIAASAPPATITSASPR